MVEAGKECVWEKDTAVEERSKGSQGAKLMTTDGRC